MEHKRQRLCRNIFFFYGSDGSTTDSKTEAMYSCFSRSQYIKHQPQKLYNFNIAHSISDFKQLFTCLFPLRVRIHPFTMTRSVNISKQRTDIQTSLKGIHKTLTVKPWPCSHSTCTEFCLYAPAQETRVKIVHTVYIYIHIFSSFCFHQIHH